MQEYWRPKIKFSIGISAGIPLFIDQFTYKPKFEREFCHYVRVLVDNDMRKPKIYRVLVERSGFAFFCRY